MTGFEVYKMYLALNMHFTKDNYDYVKYRGKVASEKAFEERKTVTSLKLATKYSGERYFWGILSLISCLIQRIYSDLLVTVITNSMEIHQESFYV